MKIKIFTIAVCCALQILSISGINAQNFKTSGRSASELFNEKYDKCITAEGDINKDGINDLVICVTDYWIDGDKFAFYFGDPQGVYTLFRDYDISLSGNTEITINDKGIVRIQTFYGDNFDVFLFRFQEGDFHLIGSKKDRHKSEHYDISHNYLTGKMIRTDGEGTGKTSKTLAMPEMPPLKFGWFPLDFDELEYLFEENTHDGQVEEKTLRGIFGRMLTNGMIFTNLSPDEDQILLGAFFLSVSMEYMSFGSYNYMSDVHIAAQEDGTYVVNINDLYEDRSYELQDHEGSDEDDATEFSDEPQEVITQTEWLFKDGKFILLKEKETRNGVGENEE